MGTFGCKFGGCEFLELFSMRVMWQAVSEGIIGPGAESDCRG